MALTRPDTFVASHSQCGAVGLGGGGGIPFSRSRLHGRWLVGVAGDFELYVSVGVVGWYENEGATAPCETRAATALASLSPAVAVKTSSQTPQDSAHVTLACVYVGRALPRSTFHILLWTPFGMRRLECQNPTIALCNCN